MSIHTSITTFSMQNSELHFQWLQELLNVLLHLPIKYYFYMNSEGIIIRSQPGSQPLVIHQISGTRVPLYFGNVGDFNQFHSFSVANTFISAFQNFMYAESALSLSFLVFLYLFSCLPVEFYLHICDSEFCFGLNCSGLITTEDTLEHFHT